MRTVQGMPTHENAPTPLLNLAEKLKTAGTPHQQHGNTLAVHDDNYQWIPDRSIDLVLTDPPFNIAQDTNFHTYAKNTINSYRFDEDKGWDTYQPTDFLQLLNQWAHEFARVLRPGGSFAVFCADGYVSHLIDALKSAGLKPRRTVTWRKPNAVPINRKTMMMSACEYIVVGVKGAKATFNSDLDLTNHNQLTNIETVLTGDKAAAIVEKTVRQAVQAVTTTGNDRPEAIATAVHQAIQAAASEATDRIRAMYVPHKDNETTYLRGCVPNHVSFNSKGGKRLHPTEKPVPLLRYLTELLSNPGDTILDPFGGSGSTGEAAAPLGRNTIVVERENDFYEKLSARLAALNVTQTGP